MANKGEAYAENAGYNPPPPGYNQPQQPGYNQQQQPGYPQQGYPMQQYPGNVVVTQAPVTNVVVANRPSDYFVFALLTCLCCFWPTGIVALVFSCNSRSAADRMDFAQAESDGRTAKIFSIVSLVIGLVWIIAVIIYAIVISVVVVDTFTNTLNNFN